MKKDRGGKARENDNLIRSIQRFVPDDVTQNPGSVERARLAMVAARRDAAREAKSGTGALRSRPRWVTMAGAVVLVAALVAVSLFFGIRLFTGRDMTLEVHRGTVHIYRANNGHLVESGTADLSEDDTVSSAGGARVEFFLGDEHTVRVDGLVELSLDAVDDEAVEIAVSGPGRTYHNIEHDTACCLSREEVLLRGDACVFDTDEVEGLIRARVFEGSIEVLIDGSRAGELSQGEEALAGLLEGGRHFEKKPLDESATDSEWYRWNRELDDEICLGTAFSRFAAFFFLGRIR